MFEPRLAPLEFRLAALEPGLRDGSRGFHRGIPDSGTTSPGYFGGNSEFSDTGTVGSGTGNLRPYFGCGILRAGDNP
jgi:hypothetical protein